jgi:hypothetical protein
MGHELKADRNHPETRRYDTEWHHLPPMAIA